MLGLLGDGLILDQQRQQPTEVLLATEQVERPVAGDRRQPGSRLLGDAVLPGGDRLGESVLERVRAQPIGWIGRTSTPPLGIGTSLAMAMASSRSAASTR